MTVEELSNICNVKCETIQRNISSIPGYRYEDGSIPNGSRWKYNIRNSKLRNTNDRRYHLLKATDEYKFIDHNMLRMSRDSFNTMIDELVQYGLLTENGTDNYFGANRYDTTMEYSRIKSDRKKSMIQNIAMFIGTAAGSYTSAVNT